MYTQEECSIIAAPYLREEDDIWENDEAYYFDDIRRKWDENYGIVVYKESGEAVSLHEYFDRKKCRNVMELFKDTKGTEGGWHG